MTTYKTKGIVLRSIKYGETSLIVTVYTELFGIQSYIVKGIRKATKKSIPKESYFQSGAILQMEVYNNALKHLQFIKEYEWDTLYTAIYSNVIKHSVALYIIELLQHTIKEPEANEILFNLVRKTLLLLDKGSDTYTANLPLLFTIRLMDELGFQLQGAYSLDTPIFDCKEGCFVADVPLHPLYTSGEMAKHISALLVVTHQAELSQLSFNRLQRSELLQLFQQYLQLHIPDFGELRTLSILQEVLA